MTRNEHTYRLNPSLRSLESRILEEGLHRKIIGQDEAVSAVVSLYEVFRAGLNPPSHPIGNLLLLGPTGTGKTHLVETVAELLLGDPRAAIKVDCAEFQHSHEIAKLIGSPPGYVGHRETEPLITQNVLERYYTEKFRISFLLFDEIEKASGTLWQLLLGILDKATLTLGDNRRVDLSQAMIFMTSNLGGNEITELINKNIGFCPSAHLSPRPRLHQQIESIATNAASRKFAPEFLNRIDKTVVFNPLQPEQLDRILQIELSTLQQRILRTPLGGCQFRLTSPAKAFLLREGTSPVYGARHLKRAIERHVVLPLANLIATRQVTPEDVVSVEEQNEDRVLTFLRAHKSGFATANANVAPLATETELEDLPRSDVSCLGPHLMVTQVPISTRRGQRRNSSAGNRGA